MDKGISVENPYAHVSIPRAQLKSSFVRDYLGEDYSGNVIANPAAFPSYPTYTAQDNRGSQYQSSGVGSGPPIRTQESWRRPYNPYASQKAPNGSHPTEMYTIELDKRHLDKRHKDLLESEPDPCCCACCKCSPCCRKCCCVVS